ncbi:MAG: Maf family protein [Betaproteobacteria bacterium]|nr:septum formation inhibitor Maf [Betaproteobacteria bacterium]
MSDPDPHIIYLASRSPRRQQLLEQIGISFRLLAPGDDEDAESLERMRPGEDPGKYVLRVTLAKAEAARERLARRGLPAAPILVADTTVAVGGTIFGKPVDAPDALRMLSLLSGRTHRVLTAVAVARGPRRIESMVNVSRVTFARIPRPELDAYVASGEPMDKAGAYGIQGAIARHVRRIEGSYSAIMGLPLYETARLLRSAGRSAP